MTDIDIKRINDYAKSCSNRNRRFNWGTHMPYVFYDLLNTQCLLFDVLLNNVWKLHIYNPLTGIIEQLNTPTKDDYTINECNPVCIIENNEYILTYTYGPISNRI